MVTGRSSRKKVKKEARISEIVRLLDEKAPGSCAESWDNVGLLVGDDGSESTTPGVLVCVDLTEEAIRTAKKLGFRLIINHHPCIFPKSKGLSRFVAPSLAFEAARSGISVISTHTNFDRCSLEVVETVSRGLGVQVRGRLIENPSESLVKLVTFVPRTHVAEVQRAIFEAGGGQIGNYDSCSFGVPGEGTFRGGEATQPFLGVPGVLEIAKEVRLETVIPRGVEGQVVHAIKKAHPYEEVAYDLYPLEQHVSMEGVVRGLGYGFWGDFSEPKDFSEMAQSVKRLFRVPGFWITGPGLQSRPRKIRRIGFVAGKGSSFIEAARRLGCDLFITGEAGFHDAVRSQRNGMAVLEMGHRESERFFAPTVAQWIRQSGLFSGARSVQELHQSLQTWIP